MGPRDNHRCPVTGLAITSRPDWTFENASATFRVRVSIVGERIVWLRASGFARSQDLLATLQLARGIVDEHTAPGLDYVHIADYTHLHGTSIAAKNLFIRKIRRRHRLAAMVFFGLSPTVALMIRLAHRVHAVPFEVRMVTDYREAVTAAVQTLGLESVVERAAPDDPSSATRLQRTPRVADAEWSLEVGGFATAMDVLDGCTLRFISEGFFREEHVGLVADLRRKVLEGSGCDRFEYVLADMSDLRGATHKARRRYLESLRQWHSEHPFRAYVVYGANRQIRAAAHLARPFVPFRVIVTDSLSSALRVTRKDRRRGQGRWRRTTAALGTRPGRRRNQRHADELVEFIGRIDWDQAEAKAPSPVPSSHPFSQVFEAIRLVRSELSELLSERADAEQALRQSRRQLQELIEHLPDGVALLDSERRVVVANPVARDALETLRGLQPSRIDDLLTCDAPATSREVTVHEPEERVFEIDHRPLEPNDTVVVIRDVTADRALRRQLAQRERLAAVGQLAAGIAHDFNNILCGMMMNADLIKARPPADDTAAQAAGEIARLGERASHLIQQILDFSRKTVSAKKPVDLAELLRDTAHLLERTIPENVSTDLACDQGPFIISGDTSQIQQLVTNLAVNARDAMGDAGGSLDLRLAGLDLKAGDDPPVAGMAPGSWVVLSVSDTGAGIPDPDIPHLFEPFFTTKEPGAGTGLGLAQVYGIVKQHEGHIDCSSRVGHGTTFRVLLPRLSTTPADGSDPPARISAAGSGETILLVEDDPSLTRAASRILGKLGFQVRTARTGDEALGILCQGQHSIDLVLSDIVMPGMSGLELVERLRALDSEIRVVLMSGYPLASDARALTTSGGVGWLKKPFTLAELAEVVGAALRSPARMD